MIATDLKSSMGERPRSWLQDVARQRIVRSLKSLDNSSLEFSDSDGTFVFGNATNGEAEIQADWNVVSNRLYSRLAADGALGLAEAYMSGEWHTNDLTNLLRVLYRNQNSGPKSSTFTAALSQLFRRFANRLSQNTLTGSRRHIAAHYDLSNQFFELFLDPTLMYSSAFFEHEDMSLHSASVAKLEQISRKLELQPKDQVLEIGTGWGGFALHAATHHDVHITTTTISAAQVAKAKQRFAEAGIERRVELLDTDYRELHGQYDKLVSIEMVEAVGERYLDGYFQKCGQLLKPGGRFVIQAIVMPEQRYDAYRRNVDFIQAYIFPGGFLPSVTAMQQSIGRTTDLRLVEVEDLSLHYARTLSAWRDRFFNRLSEVRELGFDDRFIRMWEYYLCYCEAAFREQAVRVVQIVWDKPQQ